MTLPSAWSSLTISKQRYISFHTFVQHARAGHLLGQLLTQQEAGAEVRVHAVGPFLLGHFRQMAETSEREQTRLARRAARIGLIADGAGGLASLLTYGALGLLLWSGAMELAVAGTAVLAIRTGASSLDALVLQITDLHQESLFVADFNRLCEEAAQRAIPASGMEAIEPTLREVSLTLPMGKVIALVGENGSGKSTLVKLLAGLHQPDEGGGTIRWDHVDASRADRAQIFSRVALMSQSFFRWSFTFDVNVAIGDPDDAVDGTAVEAAAEFAGAGKVLAGLPRGRRTLLARGYRGGHQISGGQWQLVGIARALYRLFRTAEILVVDEPTSALDAVAEQRVFDQIRALAATGKTIVLITHRLHSVRHADVIHVMKDGQVAESGTFSELMDEERSPSGEFRTAYLVQARAFDPVIPVQPDGARDQPSNLDGLAPAADTVPSPRSTSPSDHEEAR
ncbi:ATP-binding cassette domain-containing protein [Streptomyces sp. ISL-86]|uniref:ATP-binding cassette domain-containing protein n=1 Tax=Streptomyces sp. ISL-86 TaxID=2819187 RepID=UPI0027E59DAB|nr:ATP-binding cassette domain-containing protein [Streptomyces sp. ISL-86]